MDLFYSVTLFCPPQGVPPPKITLYKVAGADTSRAGTTTTNCRVYRNVQNDALTDLTQREWNRRQMERGNAFLANMDHKLFVLGKKQQETLDLVKRTKLSNKKIYELLN
nr:hypothetical protein [Microctonus hyperodae filamentous virus]